VKYACITLYHGAFPVRLMCRVLEVAPSGYYAWRKRPTCAHAIADERLLQPLRETEFVIATGEEDPNVAGSRQVVATLQEKGVPATLHLWNGWAHDWPFWKEMVDTFL